MPLLRIHKIVPALFVCLLALGGGSALTDAMEQRTAEIINGNTLLRQINATDPGKAAGLASEARDMLRARVQGDDRRPDRKLEFRGPLRGSPTAEQIRRDHQKDFDENPILREIYARSPLASLRMLKRLREAAKKAN